MTRKETMGQAIKCNKSASPLPCVFRDYEHREPFKSAPLVEVSDSIFMESEPISKPFLGIYNQADSYVNGVGEMLVKHFKTYEQALNLVAGGMTESIAGGHIAYEPDRRPDKGSTTAWEGLSVTPLQDDEPCRVDSYHQDDEPCRVDSYQYLYYEGRWYVRKSRSYWYDVEELLAALEGEDVTNTAYYIMESDETEEYKAYKRQRINYHDIEDEEEHMRLFRENMALYDRVFNEPWCRMLPECDNLHHPTADRIAAAVEQVKTA